MAKVTILTHDRFVDTRTGIDFKPEIVLNVDGAKVFRGVADVPDDEAREFYANHPCFVVEGLLEPESQEPEKTGADDQTTTNAHEEASDAGSGQDDAEQDVEPLSTGRRGGGRRRAQTRGSE